METLLILGIVYIMFQKRKTDSNFMQSLVDTANSQYGVSESDNPDQVMEYLKSAGWTENYIAPWCAAYVSWVYQQNDSTLKSTTVTGLINQATNAGKWNRIHSSADYYQFKKGQFFALDYNENGIPDHTGIILDYDSENQILYTIEGNYSNKVDRVTRKNTLNLITGVSDFQRPF